MMSLSEHITNIVRSLKNIKSEVMADFIHMDSISIIIVTNKVASVNLWTIEKYIKNVDYIKLEEIDTS